MSEAVRDNRGKRAAVLRGAQAVFAERGYAGATMDLIAEAAGVSKRTVYHHFSGKEELLQVIVREFLAGDERGLPPTYAPGADLPADLRRFALHEVYLIDSPNRRGLSRLLTTTFLHDPEFGVRTRGQHSPHAAFLAWCEAAREDGRLVVPDPALAARMFYGLVEGAVTWPALITDGATLPALDAILDEVCAVFLARYAAPPNGDRLPA